MNTCYCKQLSRSIVFYCSFRLFCLILNQVTIKHLTKVQIHRLPFLVQYPILTVLHLYTEKYNIN